jgi:hypothetical protein
MELLVDLGFEHTVLDHEIELLLNVGSNLLAGISRQGTGMNRLKIGGHRAMDRGHAGDHVLVALPFGAVVQHDLDRRLAGAVMRMGLCRYDP